MKSQSYMTRALQARDPRFATILGKLGYERADIRAGAMHAAPTRAHAPEEQLAATRTEYQTVVGKRPFHGWDIETLKVKIAEAKG